MNTVATISILAGVLAYAGLFVFCLVYWLRGVTGRALMLAASVTLVWLATPLFASTAPLYSMFEAGALASWIVLMIRALGLELTQQQDRGLKPVRWAFVVALGLAGASMVLNAMATFNWFNNAPELPVHLAMVVVNVLGLVLVEQLSQNSVSDYRWRVRYLNIGLGMMFAYGLLHHALSILFNGPVLFVAVLQPAVMALMVPFIVVASLRNRTNQLRFSLSRNFVFRTGVLVTSGIFLLLLGLFGYLAQLFAGELGITVAVFLSIVSMVFVFVVIGSSRFRSQLRVVLAKTFFEYRYDYRKEWMSVTAQLTEPDADFDLPQQAQRAMLSILHAKKSALWSLDNDTFRPLSDIEAPQWLQPLPTGLAAAMVNFYTEYDWVLDFGDMPEAADGITQHLRDFAPAADANYLIPLFVENRLFGVCMIGPAEIPLRLSWEDYDILKLISKQGAGFLALQEANRSLIESEQLSAVNQMSAFLLHDIKTIASQLSLMLQNAPKHRDNPAFIDDMLNTTRNSVQRMERIIVGLRQPQHSRAANVIHLDLLEWLRRRAQRFKSLGQPVTYDLKNFNPDDDSLLVTADPDALDTALTHLEQNALQAIDGEGDVTVKMSRDKNWGIIQVVDTGKGMDEAFIRNELFTPFRSTKGLTGMGIGAYQARDKIRQCGGDLQVESKVGVGSTFTIKLPLAS